MNVFLLEGIRKAHSDGSATYRRISPSLNMYLIAGL
jgi:hypothetical protein